MSTFAPPVRRGDFFYSSVLYADPGNSNPHPRASVAELAALLRPEAPNLYTTGRKPEASGPWHFYSAQLIHYGLPTTKDKNAAKVRLLNAMNQFKLEVPAWVLKVEGELKKEWDSENRKMKKSAGPGTQAGKKGLGVEDGGKGKAKAAQDRNGDVNVMGSTPTKRVKKEPVSKQTASRVKQEQLQSSPTHIPRSRVKQEYGSPLPQRSLYNSSPRIKTDPYANPRSSPSHVLLSGLYEIDCPTASEMFSDYDLDLTLALDSPRGVWWATFRWGAWDGIMQMNPGPTLGQPCSLGWRLRDLETGQLKFGKKCTGQVTFFGDQTCRGELYEVPGAGTVEFEGRRLPGGTLGDDLQHEWDAFVSEAYGR